MPANTAEGWPYVLPTDHPLEWPAHSQALAAKLDERWDTYQTSGAFVPSAPFAGSGNNVLCTRSGGMVTVELYLNLTASQTVNTAWTAMGTLPSGFRPLAPRHVFAAIQNGGTWVAPGWAEILPAGGIGIRSLNAVTLASGSLVVLLATYRGA